MKLHIDTRNIFDLNFKMYLFLKRLNAQDGITDKERLRMLELYERYLNNRDLTTILEQYRALAHDIKSGDRRETVLLLMEQIDSDQLIHLFAFCMHLMTIKPLLLAEAKFLSQMDLSVLANLHPLSMEYDAKTSYSAYSTRVHGALLALVFFQKVEEQDFAFLTQATHDYVKSLIEYYHKFKSEGVDPNQMFMLMFTESMNQSITSLSGTNYEERIRDILIAEGIPKESITKTHDSGDLSTEYDLFFSLAGKTVGISAKRTLRERYKQFIKTKETTEIDVSIEITLGTDLTEQIANTIRQHKTFIFVAPEVYKSKQYMQDIEGVFPVTEFNLATLKALLA